MMNVSRTLFAVFLFGITLAACEHADPSIVETTPPGETVSFDDIQASIFNTSCALSGCHIGTFPPQGLDLSEGQSYAGLVGVTAQEDPNLLRVDPGDPDASYLYLKIIGDPSIRGGQMPLGRDPLSATQIDLIREWILQGAEDN